MPSHLRLSAMLWELIWETLNATFDQDDLIDTASPTSFYDLDLSSADRGAMAETLKEAIEDADET